jgi:hypothetical protein
MAEYLPVKVDGDALTLSAGATITGGQVVFVSAANTVTATAGANSAWLGVAGFDAVSGDNVTVYTTGVQECTASGTIAAGNLLESAAAGAVAAHTLGTNDGNVVGTALTAATNGNKVRFLMR